MSVLTEEISMSTDYACPEQDPACSVGIFWFNKYDHTLATECKCAGCGDKWGVNVDGTPDFTDPL